MSEQSGREIKTGLFTESLQALGEKNHTKFIFVQFNLHTFKKFTGTQRKDENWLDVRDVLEEIKFKVMIACVVLYITP